jgi:hypothetical protein
MIDPAHHFNLYDINSISWTSLPLVDFSKELALIRLEENETEKSKRKYEYFGLKSTKEY